MLSQRFRTVAKESYETFRAKPKKSKSCFTLSFISWLRCGMVKSNTVASFKHAQKGVENNTSAKYHKERGKREKIHEGSSTHWLFFCLLQFQFGSRKRESHKSIADGPLHGCVFYILLFSWGHACIFSPWWRVKTQSSYLIMYLPPLFAPFSPAYYHISLWGPASPIKCDDCM